VSRGMLHLACDSYAKDEWFPTVKW